MLSWYEIKKIKESIDERALIDERIFIFRQKYIYKFLDALNFFLKIFPNLICNYEFRNPGGDCKYNDYYIQN